MSQQFRNSPLDCNGVAFTAIELQLLLDHESTISVLDYFISHVEVDDVPLLIIYLYLRSLVALREYTAAFYLLDKFVNAKSYTAARAKVEVEFSAAYISIILSVQYIQLFNHIINIYSTQFIDDLLRREPQNILTFATSFNKIYLLFLQEPRFCEENYKTQKMFKQVVDRILFLHNFIAAKCTSVMHAHYAARSQKITAYRDMIQLILDINAFGDSANRNLDSDTCLNSISLHTKGAMMAIELFKCVYNEIAAHRTAQDYTDQKTGYLTLYGQNLDLSKLASDAKAHLQQFLHYASNWRYKIADNRGFCACIFYQELGYYHSTPEILDSCQNQIAILDSLNIASAQEFSEMLFELSEDFRLNAYKSVNFASLRACIVENTKLLLTLADVAAQNSFGFLALMLYCVCLKIYVVLADSCEKEAARFHMEGQRDYMLGYYKNTVLTPFQLLLKVPSLLNNQRFEYLYSSSQHQVFDMFVEHFNPLDSAFDYSGVRAYELDNITTNLHSHYAGNNDPLQFRPVCAYRVSYIYAQLAANLLENGAFDQAVSHARTAIRVWPAYIAFFTLIKTFNKLNDLTSARNAAIECGRFYPDSRYAKVMSGETLGVRYI